MGGYSGSAANLTLRRTSPLRKVKKRRPRLER